MNPAIRCLVGAALVSAAVPSVARAQTQWCSSPYYVEQAFPTAGPEKTRWKLCWQVLNGPNLVITGAWFRPAPTAAWIKLIYDARISQLFVPYHAGSPRYHDVGYNFGPVPLTSSDCPSPTGVVLGANHETCKQVQDRGLAWKHDALLRRGQELVLWSVMAAANYNYVVEWTFRDDGTVVARVGATGQIAGTNSHMHGPIWRLDLDMNGACCNTASLFTHTETGNTANDTETDITTEGQRNFAAGSFSMLAIRNQSLSNSLGHRTHWHLMPLISGTPVHTEAFTKSTFWVSRYKWSEMLADNLPTYVSPPETTANNDLVLWYYAGLHHMVRDEDAGMTHLMWTGFMLKPANLWSTTPLYP